MRFKHSNYLLEKSNVFLKEYYLKPYWKEQAILSTERTLAFFTKHLALQCSLLMSSRTNYISCQQEKAAILGRNRWVMGTALWSGGHAVAWQTASSFSRVPETEGKTGFW